MFEVAVGSALRRALEAAVEAAVAAGDGDAKVRLLELIERGSVPCGELAELCRAWGSEVSVSEALSGLEFKFKDRETRKPSPEFQAQLARLRALQQEQEYQQIVKNRDLAITTESEATPAQINREIKEQVTTVFNIIISVISVVVAIWYWSRTSAGLAIHHRIFLCMFFGILVLVAEVVVYSSYLSKIEEAKASEKSKKEHKKLVQKYVF
ncbi:Endoplasmic reticulum-based factor for assembly of V-ATPase [Nakaseomyces glabratus]